MPQLARRTTAQSSGVRMTRPEAVHNPSTVHAEGYAAGERRMRNELELPN
jgi:hypothetical protein